MILSLLERRGHVGQEEYAAAIRELSHLPFPTREVRPANSYHFVLRLLAEEKSRGRASYAKPLRSSLDPAIQDFISSVAESALRENRGWTPTISPSSWQRGRRARCSDTWAPLFFDRENSGSIDYARTPRSSGSILKPLLFALGLDSGHFTPASVLPDLPFFVLSAQGEYRAMNFDDAYLGPMLYRRALANSRNVPALRVLEGVGLREFYELARRMELARDQSHDASYYGYGLAIGGLYVTLSDLVAVYGTLANDGRALGLGFLRGETEGKAPRQVLSPYAAREVGLFLSDDAARLPSFPRMSVLEFPFPVAIKTGTSQGFRDAWTVAYSARYVVGLWMGNPDNHPMNHVAGIVSAVYVARTCISCTPCRRRESTPPRSRFLTQRRACASAACRARQRALTARQRWSSTSDQGEAPRSLCSVHRRYAVDTRDGSPATRATPPARVALRPFSVLPAVYALWGARHGYGDVPRETDAAGGGSLPKNREPSPRRPACSESCPARNRANRRSPAGYPDRGKPHGRSSCRGSPGDGLARRRFRESRFPYPPDPSRTPDAAGSFPPIRDASPRPRRFSPLAALARPAPPSPPPFSRRTPRRRPRTPDRHGCGWQRSGCGRPGCPSPSTPHFGPYRR